MIRHLRTYSLFKFKARQFLLVKRHKIYCWYKGLVRLVRSHKLSIVYFGQKKECVNDNPAMTTLIANTRNWVIISHHV